MRPVRATQRLLATDLVRAISRGRGEFGFDALGELELKGSRVPRRTAAFGATQPTGANRLRFAGPASPTALPSRIGKTSPLDAS